MVYVIQHVNGIQVDNNNVEIILHNYFLVTQMNNVMMEDYVL